MRDPDAVVAQVAAAFPRAPVPPREALFNGHCCECAEISDAFGYKPWPEVSLEELRAGGETALLTPIAWQYYLPAAITWCVRAPGPVDVIQDNLGYQLAPREATDQEGLHEWFRQRASGFTAEQRLAIAAYLHWYRERQEAEYARFRVKPPPHVYRALEYWTGDASLHAGDATA
jgi:hypothetical protein